LKIKNTLSTEELMQHQMKSWDHT